MKKHIPLILILALSFLSYTVDAQGVLKNEKPLSNRIANYDISVKLLPEKKIIEGELLLVWKNTSKDTLSELPFHLYMNAFKNNRSTFITESGGGSLRGMGMKQADSLSWGYCKMLSIRTENGDDLTQNQKFIHPDDNNTSDQSVAAIQLINPVMPGKSIRLRIKFETKLPEIFARSGFAGNYFLAGQWFPKIGVYEHDGIRGAEKGRWNCHQYHAHSEFYADFGVYNVSITLPDNFVLGATGLLQNEKQETDGMKTLTYKAEDVLDFAWTCSPKFIEYNDSWNDVAITALMQPEHKKQYKRYISALKIALAYFDKHIGKYPYKHVTIVDPSFKGAGSAGMEYPMFITAGTIWKMPEAFRFPENVTIHEFGHNYFMALLATNEFEEAWMDEGINTYFETRIMDETYGKHNSMFNFDFYKLGDLDGKIQGYNYSSNPKIAPSELFSWKYKGGGYRSDGYAMMSYNKPSVFLTTLDRMLGRETMDKIWQTYFQRWKFKHPAAKDFCKIVIEIGAKKYKKLYNADLKEYLAQVIHGTDVSDYELAGISNKKIKGKAGFFDKNGKSLLYTPADAPEPEFKYLSSVQISRLGELIVPVELKIHFENGQNVLKVWNGKERSHIFKFKTDTKILWAKIDPAHKNVMDINLTNNSFTFKPKRSEIWKLTVKFLFFIQNLFQFFNVFI